MEALAKRVAAARPLAKYRPGLKITVSDKMGPASGMPKQYTYCLTEPAGKNFEPGFAPQLTPAQMLRAGVFSGKYLNDCTKEFPREWFARALAAGKLCPGEPDPSVNLFGVKSRQPIRTWRKNGWIPAAEGDRDPRGWFQWYCRYWLGRRMEDVDKVQIARWRAFARHAGQIKASYARLTPAKRKLALADKLHHRAKQRQALLQWAYDPWV